MRTPLKYFRFIGRIPDLSQLRHELDAHPELWNQYRDRIDQDIFKGTDDLWLRTRDPAELIDKANHIKPYWPVFYPAWRALPALRPLINWLMRRVEATHLGSVLITRIPPGKQVKPHRDSGWHAQFHQTKLYVVIRGNPDCANFCGDERVVMETGDIWWFNNLVTHRVVNDGDSARETLIVCMRTIDDELGEE